MTTAPFSLFYLQPLGASDYLELSKNFDTVIIRNIPQFSLAKRTQARRFITLIDNFYDFKVRMDAMFPELSIEGCEVRWPGPESRIC